MILLSSLLSVLFPSVVEENLALSKFGHEDELNAWVLRLELSQCPSFYTVMLLLQLVEELSCLGFDSLIVLC